jgi:hypothetical protein
MLLEFEDPEELPLPLPLQPEIATTIITETKALAPILMKSPFAQCTF